MTNTPGKLINQLIEVANKHIKQDVDELTNVPSPFLLRGDLLEQLVLNEFNLFKKNNPELWKTYVSKNKIFLKNFREHFFTKYPALLELLN